MQILLQIVIALFTAPSDARELRGVGLTHEDACCTVAQMLERR